MHYTATNTDTDHTRLFTDSNLYDHLRLKEAGAVFTPPDAALVKVYIDSAVDYIEQFTGVPLYPKAVKMFYPEPPPTDYILKYLTTNESAIGVVKYRDSEGTLTTYSETPTPVAVIAQVPNTVYFSEAIPSDATDIEINYTIAAGEINPPKGLVTLVMMLTADLYETRTMNHPAFVSKMYRSYDNILDQYRIHWRP